MHSAIPVFPDTLPRHAMPPAMASAFAASLAVHAVLLLALISWVAVGDRARLPSHDMLAILLVGPASPPRADDPPSSDYSLAVPAQETPLLAGPSMPADARGAEPPATARDAPAATAPPSAATSAKRVVSLGTVDIRLLTDDLLTRLHPVHLDRVTSEFPVEIAEGVRIDSRPDVKYPDDALAARRHGSVLAFVIVDAKGGVEEVSIIEGTPEFMQPVQDALLAARFLPAEDRGTPIRFYTMLRFDFLPSSPGAGPLEDVRAMPGTN